MHFLIYDNRSGSTLTAALLNRFKGVDVTPENDVPHKILEYSNELLESTEQLEQFFDFIVRDTRFNELGIEPEIFWKELQRLELPASKESLLKLFINFYAAHKGTGASNLILKSPNIYFHVDKLKQMFPGVKFIHVYRDGRAVYASKLRSWSNSGFYMASNPYTAAKIWKGKIDLLKRYDGILNVRYESLLAETEETLAGVLDEIKVNHSDRELSKSQADYFKAIGQDQTHLHKNLEKKPDPKHLDKWKNELKPEEVKVYETEAKTVLEEMGYDLTTDANYHLLTFRFKLKHHLARVRNAFKYLLQGKLSQKMKYQITKV